MSEQSIRSVRWTMIVINIVILLLGVGFIAWPKESSEMLARAIGIVLMTSALVEILRFIIAKTKNIMSVVIMIFAALCAVVGLWFIVNPGWLVELFGMIFGIVIAAVGLMHLHQTVFIVRKNRQIWWISLIASFVIIGLGVLVIFNPMGLTNGLMVLIGVTMVIEAVTGFFNLPAIRYVS